MAFAILAARKQFLTKRKADISHQLMQISSQRQCIATISGQSAQSMSQIMQINPIAGMLGNSVNQNMTHMIDSPLEQNFKQLETQMRAIEAELTSVEKQEGEEAKKQFAIFG